MSFKVHLIIICVIITFMYIILQVINNRPAPAPVAPVEQTSAYSITILHASWGLNCLDSFELEDTPQDSFSSSAKSKLHEDNVLSEVADLCNDKKNCTVPINTTALGDDPSPDCRRKYLRVEYRCFAYDRPWILTSKDKEKELNIDCDKQNNVKPSDAATPPPPG